MENIACIFCDRESDRVVIEENGFKGKQCPQCNLIYVSPRPTFAELEELYSTDHAHVSAGTHIFGEFRRRIVARYILRLMRNFMEPGSLLEIGSGSGYFLDEARKQAFDVYGIELSDILCDFTQTQLGIPCEAKPFGDQSFGGRKFDVVFHRDTISHFYDPIAELKKMGDRINDGGFMVFETGNLGDVDSKYYKLFDEFQFPDHLFFFSEKNVTDLLERTGFKLVKMYKSSIVPLLRFLAGTDALVERVGSLKKMKSSDEANKSTAVVGSTPSLQTPKSPPRQLAKNTYNYLYFLLRYYVGRIAPKEGRPQTLIVVAQKPH